MRCRCHTAANDGPYRRSQQKGSGTFSAAEIAHDPVCRSPRAMRWRLGPSARQAHSINAGHRPDISRRPRRSSAALADTPASKDACVRSLGSALRFGAHLALSRPSFERSRNGKRQGRRTRWGAPASGASGRGWWDFRGTVEAVGGDDGGGAVAVGMANCGCGWGKALAVGHGWFRPIADTKETPRFGSQRAGDPKRGVSFLARLPPCA